MHCFYILIFFCLQNYYVTNCAKLPLENTDSSPIKLEKFHEKLDMIFKEADYNKENILESVGDEGSPWTVIDNESHQLGLLSTSILNEKSNNDQDDEACSASKQMAYVIQIDENFEDSAEKKKYKISCMKIQDGMALPLKDDNENIEDINSSLPSLIKKTVIFFEQFLPLNSSTTNKITNSSNNSTSTFTNSTPVVKIKSDSISRSFSPSKHNKEEILKILQFLIRHNYVQEIQNKGLSLEKVGENILYRQENFLEEDYQTSYEHTIHKLLSQPIPPSSRSRSVWDIVFEEIIASPLSLYNDPIYTVSSPPKTTSTSTSTTTTTTSTPSDSSENPSYSAVNNKDPSSKVIIANDGYKTKYETVLGFLLAFLFIAVIVLIVYLYRRRQKRATCHLTNSPTYSSHTGNIFEPPAMEDSVDQLRVVTSVNDQENPITPTLSAHSSHNERANPFLYRAPDNELDSLPRLPPPPPTPKLDHE